MKCLIVIQSCQFIQVTRVHGLSIVFDPVRWSRLVRSLALSHILRRRCERPDLNQLAVVGADRAHDLSLEVELNLGVLHLLVDIRQVVLDVLIAQIDLS